jgi:hypothetical protein
VIGRLCLLACSAVITDIVFEVGIDEDLVRPGNPSG